MKTIYTLVNSERNPGNYVKEAQQNLRAMRLVRGENLNYEFNPGSREEAGVGITILPNAETQLELFALSRGKIQVAESRIAHVRAKVSEQFRLCGLSLE